MKVLALDTCCSEGSLCLQENETIILKESWLSKTTTHSEKVPRLIEDIQSELSSLTHLALTVGPGSFTGIRIGLNVMKSISYSFQIPLFSFNLLYVLALDHIKNHKKVMTLINAQKNQFFCALYTHEKTLIEPCVLSPSELPLEETLFVGRDLENIELAQNFISLEEKKTTSEVMIENLSLGEKKDFKTLLPLYIRTSSAEEALKL